MKKSLIALAVMAAAGAASAQSSVQLYGIADVWAGSLKSQTYSLETGRLVGERQTGLYDGGVSNSRWGLTGSEDLGGGLKATFTLEQGFSLDDGTAISGFNREATVGFAGNFGAVKLGKQFNAFDDVSGAQSSVFDSDLAPINTVFLSTAFAATEANTVKYVSPSFGGFTGSASYSFGENKTAAADATNNYALAGQYANGPLALGIGYAVNDKGADNDKAIRLNGAYDLGVAKLKGSYGHVKGDRTTFTSADSAAYLASPAFLATYGAGGNTIQADKTNEFEIGVDVPLASNLVLSAGYAQSKDKLDGVEQAKRSGYGLAVAYLMSKRTTGYAGLNATKVKSDGETIGKTNILAVGVKHAF